MSIQPDLTRRTLTGSSRSALAVCLIAAVLFAPAFATNTFAQDNAADNVQANAPSPDPVISDDGKAQATSPQEQREPDSPSDQAGQGAAPTDISEVGQSAGIPQSAGLPEAENVGPGVYGPPVDEVLIEYPPGVPEDLARGVAYALDAYPAIRAARLQEEATDQEVRAAKGQRFPTVTVDGQGLTGGSDVVTNQNLALNLTVQQPIWSGGRIGAAIDRAKAARTVSQAQTRERGETIAVQVIDAYYQAVLSLRRMKALEEGNSQLLELVNSIDRRVKQEISPKADLTLVQSRQAEIQRQYQLAQATYYSARENFRQLTGLFGYQLDAVPPYPGDAAHPQSADPLAESGECNPVIKRLAAQAKLAEAEVEVAKREIYPTLSAQFSRNEVTGTRFGVVVRSTLSDGLSQFRVIDASKARSLQATTDIQTATIETRVRLTNDLLLNYSTREQIPIVLKAVEAATDLTVSYRRQFVAGRRSWLDVVNAVREEITADLNLVEAETTAMNTGARILIYTCRWTPAIGS